MEEVHCPDCHKVIAPPGAVEEILRCRCAEVKEARLSPEEVPTHLRISVPVPEIRQPTEDLESLDERMPAAKEKTCYVCGKDLTGRTRLKDHLGRYWCKECAKADARAKRREEELRCPDCGRVFPAGKLQYFQTAKVCSTCFKEREKELEKKIVKANAEKLHKSHEFGKLKWMALIAAGLIIIATIFQFMR